MSLVVSEAIYYDLWRDSPAVSSIADDIRKSLSQIRVHNDESVVLGWRINLRDQIVEIADECGMSDWDSEGGLPISSSSRSLAEKFVDLIPDSVSIPAITPENSGGYSFDWQQGKDMLFSVSLIDERAIFAGIFGNEKLHGELRIQDEMPEQIFRILERFFKRKG